MLDIRAAADRLDAAALARYRPSLDDVRTYARGGNLVPIYREIMADLETPVSAYLKIAAGSDYASCWRASRAASGWRATRSSAADPYLTLRLDDGVAHANQQGYKQASPYTDPLVALQSFLAPYRAVEVPDLPRFLGGAVGYLGYEAVRYFEELPAAANPALTASLPEGRVHVRRHAGRLRPPARGKIKVVSPRPRRSPTPIWSVEYAPGRRRASRRLIERLQAPVPAVPHAPTGPLDVDRPRAARSHNMTRDYYDSDDRAGQGVHRGRRHLPGRALAALRGRRPAPPVHDLPRAADDQPVAVHVLPRTSATIRSSARRRRCWCRSRTAWSTTHPIAGTRPRGATTAEDDALAAELLPTRRSGPSTSCWSTWAATTSAGSPSRARVRVPTLLEIERYSHVMHLVSQRRRASCATD